MNTKETSGRISDPNNPCVAEYHSIGHDILALQTAMGALKGDQPGFKKLRDSLKRQKLLTEQKRINTLRAMHIIDQDNKPWS